MSRRRRGDKTAFGTYTLEVHQALRALFQAELLADPQPTLSHRDVLEMFATPDEVYVLEQAAVIAAVSKWYAERAVNSAPFSFELVGDSRPLIPKTPVLQNPDDPRWVAITSWSAARREVAYKWGLALKLFDFLNDLCSTPQQVRYIWPSILGVLRTSSRFESLIPTMEEFKRPSNLPSYSVELKHACEEGSQIVTTGLILKDIVAEPAELPVKVTFTGHSAPRHHAYLGAYHPLSE